MIVYHQPRAFFWGPISPLPPRSPAAIQSRAMLNSSKMASRAMATSELQQIIGRGRGLWRTAEMCHHQKASYAEA
jgi:hypothetical protein